MITPDAYRIEHGIRCVTMPMIQKRHTENEVANFLDWISRQTCMIGENGESLIYAHDYERWLRQGMQSEQSAADWD